MFPFLLHACTGTFLLGLMSPPTPPHPTPHHTSSDIFFLNRTLTDVFICRYTTLEVKNILLESVLHHILPQMLNSPFLQQTADLVKDYLKFMDDHLKESADLTCLAYRHRTYSKVGIVLSCWVVSAWNHVRKYIYNRYDAPLSLWKCQCVMSRRDYYMIYLWR